MSLKKAVVIIILVLVIDQISKVYIKTSFILGDGFDVFSWFKIHFVENKGMAWGIRQINLNAVSFSCYCRNWLLVMGFGA